MLSLTDSVRAWPDGLCACVAGCRRAPQVREQQQLNKDAVDALSVGPLSPASLCAWCVQGGCMLHARLCVQTPPGPVRIQEYRRAARVYLQGAARSRMHGQDAAAAVRSRMNGHLYQGKLRCALHHHHGPAYMMTPRTDQASSSSWPRVHDDPAY